MEKNNLEVWNNLKHPPESALSEIKGGRMSGKTDINPQWRYQAMTEEFGVCGIGWKFEIVRMEIVEGSNDQKVAFVDIKLFIKNYQKNIP